MLYFILFFIQIFILFFLSKQISLKLSFLFFNIFKSQKITIKFLAILFLPGTIIHELSHMFMASFLFVRTGKMEFFPQILSNNSVKLGSVAIAKCDPVRRFMIGVAPLLGGVGLLALTFYLFNKGILALDFKTIILFLISFEIGNTMFSSSKDMEGAIGLLISIIIIGGILFILGKSLSYQILNFLILIINNLGAFFKSIDIILLFPMIVDLILFGVLYLLKSTNYMRSFR